MMEKTYHMCAIFCHRYNAFKAINVLLMLTATRMSDSMQSPNKRRLLMEKTEGSPKKKHCRELKQALGKREALEMRTVDPHFSALKNSFDGVLREKHEMAKKNEDLKKYIHHLKLSQKAKS